jgi:hypothetical protein
MLSYVIPREGGESSNRLKSVIIARTLRYWIARIIKLVLGPAKPDPSAGQ